MGNMCRWSFVFKHLFDKINVMNITRSLRMDNGKVYDSKTFLYSLNLTELVCYFSTLCDPKAIYQGTFLIIVEN